MDIQEDRNAIKTYELYPKLNPFSIQDLLLAHRTMMAGLVDEAGMFRSGGVGVFNGDKPIHIAPPAGKVKGLMNELFGWLERSDDHLLIRSCVFHYFMLEEILDALVGHQGKSNAEIAGEMGLGYQHERVLGYLRADNHTKAAKIAEDLDMSARQIERIIADLKAKGVIRRVGANRNGYWEVL